jgi:branched-chain amino acid transport system ATP-binding protein
MPSWAKGLRIQTTVSIFAVNQEGLSILLVEQNLGMAIEVATYAYILSKGKTVYGGSVDELEANPQVMERYLAVV